MKNLITPFYKEHLIGEPVEVDVKESWKRSVSDCKMGEHSLK